jgi:hypothetical protein
MTTRTSTASRDDLGWDKSPEIPSLSNGVDAASPPLVVVGGIAFIGKRRRRSYFSWWTCYRNKVDESRRFLDEISAKKRSPTTF